MIHAGSAPIGPSRFGHPNCNDLQRATRVQGLIDLGNSGVEAVCSHALT